MDALLIDRNKQLKFVPATIAKVTPKFVENHFIGPWRNGLHPLIDLK